MRFRGEERKEQRGPRGRWLWLKGEREREREREREGYKWTEESGVDEVGDQARHQGQEESGEPGIH